MSSDGRIEISTAIDSGGIQEGIKEIASKLEQVVNTIKQAGDSINASLTEAIRNAGKKAEETTARVKSVGQQAIESTQAMADKIKTASDGIKTTGDNLSKYISLPIAGFGAAAFKMSNDFNAAMANVSTLIPNNIARIQELKTTVQQMAESTGKSTSDIADGLYQVISTFGDSADTAKILGDNVKAAAAGMATTTDAINLTASVSKGYNDTSEQTIKHITDLAFQTANLGITTFPELSKSIGGVTPLAATLGIKMEDMFAVFATGSGVTGDTSQVATQFQNVLQSLMAPTTSMSKLMKDLGYSNGEAMLKSLGLQGTINKIVDTAKKANVPLQDYIGSIDGQTLALALNGNLSKGFTDNLKAMGNVAGSTDQAFKQQTDGINKAGFQWEQAKQKMAVFTQTIGDALAPVLIQVFDQLNPFAAKLQDMAKAFSAMDPATKKIIVAFLAFMVALGPILSFVGRIGLGISMLIKMFAPLAGVIAEAGGIIPLLGTALTALTGPIGLIILAVSALVAGFIYLWNTNKSFRESMQKLWIEIQANFTFALTFIEAIVIVTMSNVMAFIQDILSKIKVFWSEHGDQIMQLTTQTFSSIWGVIKGVMGIIIGLFQVIWPNIVNIVVLAWAVIKTTIKVAIDIIAGVLSVGLDLLTGKWGKALNDIKTAGKRIWDDIINTFKGINLESIGENIINGLIRGIQSMAKGVSDVVRSIASGIPDGIKKFLGISSPSKLMRDQVGKWIPEGLAQGIKMNASVVTNSVNEMAKNVIPVMPQNLMTINKSSVSSSKNGPVVNVYPKQAIINENEVLNSLRRAALLYGN